MYSNFLTKTFQDAPNIYINYPKGANGPLEVSGMVYDIWHHFEVSSNFRYYPGF